MVTAPAHRAATAYRACFDADPDGVWSAPGRVNLIGEHTDYADGYVLPFAIPHRAAVAAGARDDDLLVVATVDDDGQVRHAPPVAVSELAPGQVSGWAAYPAGVAWVLRDHGYARGANLVIASDVPRGGGLSSSHALECAVALALLGLAGVDVPADDVDTRRAVARWVQRAENDFVGAPTGILDQTASLLSAPDRVLFYDVRHGSVEHIPFEAAAADLCVLVIDTRTQHDHADGWYGARRRAADQAAELLGVPALRDVEPDRLAEARATLPAELAPIVRHVVTENQRVLDVVAALRDGDLSGIGDQVNASHDSLRDDYGVSCPELDLAVDTARQHGALGARMIGGGFGGSAIALVAPDRVAALDAELAAVFAARGFRTPRTFPVTPSAGAGRDTL